jgi:hypothetical protein
MRNHYTDTIEGRQEELKERLDRRWQPETSEPVFSGSGSTVRYEISDRVRAISYGGLGLIQQLVGVIGLPEEIDSKLHLLKRHVPYHESDHILNIVYCLLSGGKSIEDINLLRQDLNYLDSLGARRIPHPTTAGDFLRRFKRSDNEMFLDVNNEVQRKIWLQQPEEMKEVALIDVDGTIQEIAGECKEGADFSYNGKWGYGPLLLSLANSGEVLSIVNRGANRPSHDGAAERINKAIGWAKSAGFQKVRLRGDTDFSLTKHFDRWDDDGVEFTFGMDANPVFVRWASELSENEFLPLERREKGSDHIEPRMKPFNYKEATVIKREYVNKKLHAEHVAEIEYQPTKSKNTYRLIVLRKNISIEKGERKLLDEISYFFYVTNISSNEMMAEEIIFENNNRCNQENLIKQLKSGVNAFKSPAVEFNANWAFMIIGALAWNLKPWLALTLPDDLDLDYNLSELITMGFRRFLSEAIQIPAQVLRSGRRTIHRLLSCPRLVRLIIEGSNWLRQQLCSA